ncbi:MAG: hypothetical protein E7638_07810, partial [Ruminococcaceae bacterium]|nr:hypothetical protein [Oscillospiraceae bacterium]
GNEGDIWLGESGASLLDDLREDVSDTIARMYVPLIAAEEYGISPEDELIRERVELKMDGLYEAYDFDYRAYLGAISESHMNDGAYRFTALCEAVSDELFHAMIREGEIITDEDALLELFRSDAFIRAKQILIPHSNGKTKEENLAHAEELLELAQGGADFDKLVQEYSKDLSMFNNPDGYYMMKGTYYEEFEDAAFSLEVGEVSGIVETPVGYSIIKRCEKEDGYITSHMDELTSAYGDSVYNLKLEEVLSTVTVEATDALDDYSVFTLE